MNISHNWLKDYLKTDMTPQEMSVVLTDIGLEVDKLEKTETIRGGLQGVVVGEILSCEKHPDADRLRVTSVSVGAGEPLSIVCGAPNVAAGQKVLVATVGTTLYPKGEEEGFKIKKSKIRGVESLGMICAEDELGIGDDHEGILVLAPDAVPGTPGREVLKIEDDYLFEIGLTPNRVDAASHYGVARDLAAYLRAQGEMAELSLPPVDHFAADNHEREIKVEVIDHDAAPRYTGVTITGIKITPSPEWLQNRLRSIGMNPKNNVVDITNYVLHEVGQPLHAFDADKVEGGRIVVRKCADQTPFTTLDEVERKLSAEDLMICSAERPMCIGGVFGGLDSGVTEQTTAIFLESAYFAPTGIRKTARRHGLSTDSSFRFERGADPEMTVYALKRAALLIKELSGGKISSEITDLCTAPPQPFRFSFSPDRFYALAGKRIPEDTLRRIVDALEVKIESESDGVWNVAVPPYRVDVQREADLSEDILRLYGYNNIEIPRKINASIPQSVKPDPNKIRNIVADLLSANGFAEAMSNSLSKESYYEGLADFPSANCVRMLNPLSSDLSVMRQTLLFGLLESAELNNNRRNPDLKLYEFGNCYYFDKGNRREGEDLSPYREKYMLGVLVTGLQHLPSWNNSSAMSDFFTLRKYTEKVLGRFGIDIFSLDEQYFSSQLYSEGLEFRSGKNIFFRMGRLSQPYMNRFGLRNPVYYVEMEFPRLVRAAAKAKVRVQELSKFPGVRRDLALLVDKAVPYSRLREVALATERKILKKVSLFDVYEGDKLPEGKKSYALNFVLEDPNKTLTDQFIDRTMNNLIAVFEKECGATVRS